MSKFFDSEVVRESVFELERLQTQLSTDLLNLANYDYEQRKEHLETLKTFLEKQKIFFFRVSLSDDPDALLIKEKVIETGEDVWLQRDRWYGKVLRDTGPHHRETPKIP